MDHKLNDIFDSKLQGFLNQRKFEAPDACLSERIITKAKAEALEQKSLPVFVVGIVRDNVVFHRPVVAFALALVVGIFVGLTSIPAELGSQESRQELAGFLYLDEDETL